MPPTIISLVAIAISTVSLVWAIGWSLWVYRRTIQPALLVVPQPAIITAGKNAYFIAEGSRKKEKIRNLEQWCIGIDVHNIGPASVTIDRLEGGEGAGPTGLSKWRQKTYPLVDCWLLVRESEKLPRVLKSGEKWSGICDYHLFVSRIGVPPSKNAWQLRVRVHDTFGRTYVGSSWITHDALKYLAERRREAAQ